MGMWIVIRGRSWSRPTRCKDRGAHDDLLAIVCAKVCLSVGAPPKDILWGFWQEETHAPQCKATLADTHGGIVLRLRRRYRSERATFTSASFCDPAFPAQFSHRSCILHSSHSSANDRRSATSTVKVNLRMGKGWVTGRRIEKWFFLINWCVALISF
jgi:hypothetical protein